MNVSRSGYYKWICRKDKVSNSALNQKDIRVLIQEIHEKHPTI